MEECFKASEIEILESSKRVLLQSEYCSAVKTSIVQESIKSSLAVQWQLSQAQLAMTLEELNRVRMLEKTKDVLVCKVERYTHAHTFH